MPIEPTVFPVDLHMHSTASDGTDSPAVLLENVRAAGIRTFSVTDHDTIDGALTMEALVPADMTYVRGVEVSCYTEVEKCHILGYAYDPDCPAFQEVLEEGHRRRRAKFDQRVAWLASEHGIVLTKAEIEDLLAIGSVGKPHLGNLLARKGYAADKNEAITKFINPCPVTQDRVEAGFAIRGILAAGGIPVWAHPYGGTDEKEIPEDDFRRQLQLLLSEGIRGLECWYSHYPEEKVESLLAAAREHHLLVSGGSDYHGKNKPVWLGKLNGFGRVVPPEELTVLEALTARRA